ncbi:hypothetical protein AVEN_198619-1 [Araneus ventricosus]|uniref:Transposase Tc1-like domain-containing protein n=1 Tax=Araneus ventricosus TaxID=182803 RepID=A0A4Y2NVC5_ARAVE|nr:hypothetical protein AVEN_198619-1 [Araneus ventricosus]
MPRIWKRVRDTGDVNTQPRQGRKASVPTVRTIIWTAKRNKQFMLVHIASEFAVTTGTRLPIYTATDWLNKIGLFAKFMICLPSSQVAKCDRLKWFRHHCYWSTKD